MTRTLTRRTFVLGASAVVLAGCRVSPSSTPSTSAVPAVKPRTTAELLALPEFTVAHRGSGDNWPEHTLRAYSSALAAGAMAVEISVRRTADDVLVCFHDADTLRATGKKGKIAGLTYAELATRPVDARAWLGPATRLEPIPRLDDVLDALPDDALIFIEDKDGTNTDELLSLVMKQPNAGERFVWKQWAAAQQIGAAREAGLLSWGYYTAEITDRIQSLAGDFSALGIGVEQSDAVVREVVATGVPVIAWEVHRRSEKERLRALGVRGLMCSNVPYVDHGVASATTDAFSTGLRAAGDLPMVTNEHWEQQPEIADSALTISKATTGRVYTMGSLCPLPSTGYTLEVDLRFDADPGKVGAGFAFAADSDAAYAPEADNGYGAYRVKVWPSGLIELADHPAGWAAPRTLASIETAPLVAGDSLTVIVEVTPYRLSIRRRGATGDATVADMNRRGGYLHLWNQAWPVTFSGIRVV